MMGKLSKNINSDNTVDSIRIKGDKILLKFTAISGMSGDYFLFLVPSLNISGYGTTEQEALAFLEVEAQLFCEDLSEMKIQDREQYLISLGFSPEKFHSKNFSKAFVDDNGVLQNFEAGTTKKHQLQVA